MANSRRLWLASGAAIEPAGVAAARMGSVVTGAAVTRAAAAGAAVAGAAVAGAAVAAAAVNCAAVAGSGASSLSACRRRFSRRASAPGTAPPRTRHNKRQRERDIGKKMLPSFLLPWVVSLYSSFISQRMDALSLANMKLKSMRGFNFGEEEGTEKEEEEGK